MLTQTEQNRIWELQPEDAFAASAPRQRALAMRCRWDDDVLTIGIGDGSLERLIAARGAHVFAVDPCPTTVERIGSPLVDAHVAESHALPFPDNHFDVVIMSETLEHVAPTLVRPTLREIWRVLRIGAKLYLTVPMCEDLTQNQVVCPYCESGFHRWGHQQSFDKAKIRGLLASTGFHSPIVRPCAFADFHRRDVFGLARSCVRAVLGRIGAPIVSPVWDVHAWKFPMQYDLT